MQGADLSDKVRVEQQWKTFAKDLADMYAKMIALQRHHPVEMDVALPAMNMCMDMNSFLYLRTHFLDHDVIMNEAPRTPRDQVMQD